jgi:hypothetical protein
MTHVLSNQANIRLSPLPEQLFHQCECKMELMTMQRKNMSTLIQECLPFLHASGKNKDESISFRLSRQQSGGQIRLKPDGSMIFNGSLFILNSIQSFLIGKVSTQQRTRDFNVTCPCTLQIETVSVKILIGQLLDQEVDSVLSVVVCIQSL